MPLPYVVWLRERVLVGAKDWYRESGYRLGIISRASLAGMLDRAGLLSLALGLRTRVPSPWLPVLTYHRFASPAYAGALDDAVADSTPEMFERQMSLLARWFTVVSLEDVFAFRAGKPLPPNPVLVTFDDGYKDGLEIALPILKRHGVRATFFIATDYVSRRRLFWWDRIHLLVKTSRRERLELSYPSPLELDLRTDPERLVAAARLIRVIKHERELDLERFLLEVAEASGVSMDRDEERRMADALVMTWNDVRTLRDEGMSVQSHTRSHRTLHTVPPTHLRDELGGSREVLEGELGERVRAIAYPVGRRLGSESGLRAAVHAAGYDLGFSSGSGVNDVWTLDALNVRRLSVDVTLGDSLFLAMLCVPGLGY